MEQNIKVAVDAIVFGYEAGRLDILLIQPKSGLYKDKWALPGGLVLENESLQDAVHRELQEETNVKVNYLEQLYTFGDTIDRDPRGRVISVSYFGLVNPSKRNLVADTDAARADWFPAFDLPDLAYDHKNIIDVAISRLQAKIRYEPIGFDLLNKKFPFSDLEQLYVTILQKSIDRRNFRKKVLKYGFLKEVGESNKKVRGRPSILYSFDAKVYKQLQRDKVNFEI